MRICWKQVIPVFVLGLVLGAAMGSWCHRAMFRKLMKGGPNSEWMLKKLGRDLELDAGQKEALKKVLDVKHEEMRAFHKETGERFRQMRASFEADIKKVLTPEQQAEFDALSIRWKTRHPAPEEKR
ncbi:MAG: hypothetical protein WC728_09275 [Elusimicrobiota bacterium]